MKIWKNNIVKWYLVASAVGVALYLIGVVRNQSLDYWYLVYNLLLALLPVAFALLTRRQLKQKELKNWRSLLSVFLWLLFLPNSFYIVTDFIHLPETTRVDIVQDSVMLMQFSVLGLIAGFYSLLVLHKVFLRYFSPKLISWAIALVLLLCSFAIYLGRELRWNSWDIVLHPLTLLRDSLLIVVQPTVYGDAWFMILSFFGMLGSLYALLWHASQNLHDRKKPATEEVTGSSTTRKREGAKRP